MKTFNKIVKKVNDFYSQFRMSKKFRCDLVKYELKLHLYGMNCSDL